MLTSKEQLTDVSNSVKCHHKVQMLQHWLDCCTGKTRAQMQQHTKHCLAEELQLATQLQEVEGPARPRFGFHWQTKKKHYGDVSCSDVLTFHVHVAHLLLGVSSYKLGKSPLFPHSSQAG